jgi:hypothetical protein
VPLLLLNSVHVTYTCVCIHVYNQVPLFAVLTSCCCCCPPRPTSTKKKRSTYSGPSCDIFLLFTRLQQCYLFIMTITHTERERETRRKDNADENGKTLF